MAEVTFKVICDTNIGDLVCLVGNIPELNSWNKLYPIFLSSENYSSECHLWQSDKLILPLDTSIEYKFFIKDGSNKIIWEQLPGNANHMLYFKTKQKATVLGIFGNVNRQISLSENEFVKEDMKEDVNSMDFKFSSVISFITKGK